MKQVQEDAQTAADQFRAFAWERVKSDLRQFARTAEASTAIERFIDEFEEADWHR